MGKARRKLDKARKEIFKEIDHKYGSPREKDYHSKKGFAREDVNSSIVDLSREIRECLFEYVEHTSYPLCEYLDIDNMTNYIEYLLSPL